MAEYLGFRICLLGLIAMVPLHFRSVEHLKLQKKYGQRKGTRIGEIYGLISGWGFFLFWGGMWISPQPRFAVSSFIGCVMLTSFTYLRIPITHLIISIPFLAAGCWFGIRGVKATTLKVSETHRTERIVTEDVYSIVRHPQYLGGLLSHVGVTFLLSALYSLIFLLLCWYFWSTLSPKKRKKSSLENSAKSISTTRRKCRC